MQRLTLAQIFGAGTSQDMNVLIINKASLLGLSATTNNTAESLLAAIFVTALQNFQGAITDENDVTLTDENEQPIAFDNSEAFDGIGLMQWKPFFAKKDIILYQINQIIAFIYVPN
ncbi:hypothetical protein [Nostoc sp.]|uniref:hypothetical protein n=1 Tax=Nostoc sp. TaxID=1180 RepID=UPI002FF4656E